MVIPGGYICLTHLHQCLYADLGSSAGSHPFGEVSLYQLPEHLRMVGQRAGSVTVTPCSWTLASGLWFHYVASRLPQLILPLRSQKQKLLPLGKRLHPLVHLFGLIDYGILAGFIFILAQVSIFCNLLRSRAVHAAVCCGLVMSSMKQCSDGNVWPALMRMGEDG